MCDGCDDLLDKVLADTPSAAEVMSSITPFSGVELKDNPTLLSCLIESGFYRGPVLKTRPSFAKVRVSTIIPTRCVLRLITMLQGFTCSFNAGGCKHRRRQEATRS